MSDLWTWLSGFSRELGFIIATISGVLAFSQKWWLPKWRAWRLKRAAVASVPEKLSTFIENFDVFRTTMEGELKTNHGSSLRDAINRIELVGRGNSNTVNMLLGMVRHQADTVPVATFECDPKGLYQWVNTAFLAWTGFQPEHCVGWGWINCVALADRDRLRDEWEAAVVENRAFTSTYRMLVVGNKVVQVDCKANPIRNAQGEIAKWMGTITRSDELPMLDERFPGAKLG